MDFCVVCFILEKKLCSYINIFVYCVYVVKCLWVLFIFIKNEIYTIFICICVYVCVLLCDYYYYIETKAESEESKLKCNKKSILIINK